MGSVLPVFKIVMREAGSDEAAFKKAVANWYDAGMERADGWYKRQTQRVMLTLGLLIAVTLNIDAVRIATTVARFPPQDQQPILAVGGRIAAKIAPNPDLYELGRLKIPFGWTKEYRVAGDAVPWTADWRAAWLMALAGWLIVALAASLASQFSFDVLVRFVNIRAAGVKPDDRPKESPKAAGD